MAGMGGMALRGILGGLVKTVILFVLAAAAWLVSPVLGSLVLLAGSMLWVMVSMGADQPVGILACLFPPIAYGLGFLAQAGSLEFAIVPEYLIPALAAGAVLGLLRGATYRLHQRDGRWYARGSFLIVALWGLCYLATQLLALAGAPLATQISLAASGLTTCMLVTATAILLLRYATKPSASRSFVTSGPPMSCLALLCALVVTSTTGPAFGQSQQRAANILRQIVSRSDFDDEIESDTLRTESGEPMGPHAARHFAIDDM